MDIIFWLYNYTLKKIGQQIIDIIIKKKKVDNQGYSKKSILFLLSHSSHYGYRSNFKWLKAKITYNDSISFIKYLPVMVRHIWSNCGNKLCIV
jgi:hypothetical protein